MLFYHLIRFYNIQSLIVKHASEDSSRLHKGLVHSHVQNTKQQKCTQLIRSYLTLLVKSLLSLHHLILLLLFFCHILESNRLLLLLLNQFFVVFAVGNEIFHGADFEFSLNGLCLALALRLRQNQNSSFGVKVCSCRADSPNFLCSI